MPLATRLIVGVGLAAARMTTIPGCPVPGPMPLATRLTSKTPQTGEVEKAYKPSWETGLFYRDPYSGYTVGGVEEGSRLQEELQQNGWYQLQESLSGQFGDND